MAVRLAQALDTTPDEILAATPRADMAAEPTIDRRFLRRLERLPALRRDQQALLGTINAFLGKVS